MVKQWTGGAGAIIALVIALSLGFSQDANAYGGSWGSSRGGFGSGGGSWGGSSGGGGILAGRKPVRNLLGLVGSGISAIGGGLERIGNLGSNGGLGSSGGHGSSGGGLLGGGRLGSRLFGGGSSGGGWGGNGGWGSSGSSLAVAGSTGSSTGSSTGYSGWSSGASYDAGVSYGSTGGLYAGTATENYYGDWGTSYLSGASTPGYAIGSINPIGSTVPFGDSMIYGSVEDVYSGPVVGRDDSFANDVSLDGGSVGGIGVPGAIETGFDAPVLDYGSSPSLSPSFNDSLQPQPGAVFGPLDGQTAPGSGFGDGLPDAPIPDADSDSSDDSTSLQKQNSEAVLSLNLPLEAKVYINGKLTKTEGRLRQYVSRNLTKQKEYRYRVKAVVEKDGQRIVRTKMVSMKPGKDRVVNFDFSRPQVTTLVLKVPVDAEVYLDGNKTNARGSIRTFSTEKLTDNQAWKDYQIEVRYLNDGRQVVKTRSLDLIAGSTEVVAIGPAAIQIQNDLRTAIAKR